MTTFRSPQWVPKMEPVADDIPISELMLNEKYGRFALEKSKPPFVCGLTGDSYTWKEVAQRTEYLARALKHELNITDIHDGTKENGFNQMEKVVGIFSVNCLDYATLAWSTQRLNGILSPANAVFPVDDLTYQLKDSKSRILFTCASLIDVATAAAQKAGIAKDKIFILKTPPILSTQEQKSKAEQFRTLDDLIKYGKKLKAVESLRWEKGYARKKIAFLCYSSGTSGLPKGVMIAHHNVMTNIIQNYLLYTTFRHKVKTNVLGLLPQSHIYCLVLVTHEEIYAGNSVILLPKFELTMLLEAIARFKMEYIFLVPPIVISLAKNKAIVDKYDFSSVEYLMTGAAPMTAELGHEVSRIFPTTKILQGYGMTECSTVVANTSPEDIWQGSSGVILPNIECRIVDPEGKVLGEGERGELQIKGDNVTLGYLNNPKATKETFKNGWLSSGDEALIQKSEAGNYHLFVVDRLKDLVKVKGHQVAPAELEGHLLKHPKVSDCAVIPVEDEAAGEYPKAFVVLVPGVKPSVDIEEELKKWVADHKAHYKRLQGGVEFTDIIPKNASGKILRRMLRDKEREKRRKKGAKL